MGPYENAIDSSALCTLLQIQSLTANYHNYKSRSKNIAGQLILQQLNGQNETETVEKRTNFRGCSLREVRAHLLFVFNVIGLFTKKNRYPLFSSNVIG